MNCFGLVVADAQNRMLPRTQRLSPRWHHSRQRDWLLPALPQAGEVSLPRPQTNAHSSQGTCEKEITQALRSAHSPYTQFLPLPPGSYLRLVFVQWSEATGLCGCRAGLQGPAGPARVLGSPCLLPACPPSPASILMPEKIFFFLCELLQLLLFCITKTITGHSASLPTHYHLPPSDTDIPQTQKPQSLKQSLNTHGWTRQTTPSAPCWSLPGPLFCQD